MSALFGPAGNCDSFIKTRKSSVHAPAWLRNKGLDCYEYQCGRGVNISQALARDLGAQAALHDIALSVHSPYFINLSAADEVRMRKNTDYILSACLAASWMGGDRVVVHCGGLSGMARAEAMQNTRRGIADALRVLDEQGLGHITLCIETMGKVNMIGTTDEVFSLCADDERLLPCIDFGHVNCRTGGGLNDKAAYTRIFDDMENMLGVSRASRLHIHFSKIEYSAGGEVRHLTLDDSVYGPDFEPLIDIIAARSYSPRIICESAGTQAEDALTMRQYYTSIKREI